MPNYLLIYLFDNCYVIYLNKNIEDNYIIICILCKINFFIFPMLSV